MTTPYSTTPTTPSHPSSSSSDTSPPAPPTIASSPSSSSLPRKVYQLINRTHLLFSQRSRSPNPSRSSGSSSSAIIAESEDDFQIALKDLSTHWTGTTTRSGRSGHHSLRNSLERRSLQTFEEFYDKFKSVYDRLGKITSFVGRLSQSCEKIEGELKEHDLMTEMLISKIELNRTRREELGNQKEAILQFLEKFRLSDAEVSALVSGPVASPMFFRTLARVHEIQEGVKDLIQRHTKPSFHGDADGDDRSGGGDLRAAHGSVSVSGVRAPLELLNDLSMYQNAAYDRLSRWIQEMSRLTLTRGGEEDHHRMGIGSSSFETSLRVAIRTLISRPALLRSCLSELADARKGLLRNKFAAFEASPGLRKRIHDPVVFSAEILGWVHRAAAEEREMVRGLFYFEEEEREVEREVEVGVVQEGKEADGEEKDEEVVADSRGDFVDGLLSEVFEGLVNPVTRAIEQVLHSRERRSSATLFRLAHLFEFYAELLGQKFLPTGSPFVLFLKDFHATTLTYFFKILEEEMQVLVIHRIVVTGDSADVVPSCIVEILRTLEEILLTHKDDVVSREKDLLQVVEIVLGSVMSVVRRTAEKLMVSEPSEDTKMDSVRMQHLATVFVMNCLAKVSSLLSKFAFAEARLHEISEELDDAQRTYISLASADLITRYDFTSKLQMIKKWQTQSEETRPPLCTMPGFSQEQLKAFLLGFYGSLYEFGATGFSPAFCGKIRNLKLRTVVRTSSLVSLANAYQTLHAAISSPKSGYDNPIEIAFHSPEQVRLLLEI